jgi:uncharacterized membrane protein YvbJ
MKYCPKCGARVGPTDGFCPGCGCQLNGEKSVTDMGESEDGETEPELGFG